MVDDEPTDFMDHHWNRGSDVARKSVLRPADDGFTDSGGIFTTGSWRSAWRCSPRSGSSWFAHTSPASRSSTEGRISPVPGPARAARFLADLDEYFIRATLCLVSDVPLGFFPVGGNWNDFPEDARVELERDIRGLCTSPASRCPRHQSPHPSRRRLRRDVDPQVAVDDLARLSKFWGEGFTSTAADEIAGGKRRGNTRQGIAARRTSASSRRPPTTFWPSPTCTRTPSSAGSSPPAWDTPCRIRTPTRRCRPGAGMARTSPR